MKYKAPDPRGSRYNNNQPVQKVNPFLKLLSKGVMLYFVIILVIIVLIFALLFFLVWKAPAGSIHIGTSEASEEIESYEQESSLADDETNKKDPFDYEAAAQDATTYIYDPEQNYSRKDIEALLLQKGYSEIVARSIPYAFNDVDWNQVAVNEANEIREAIPGADDEEVRGLLFDNSFNEEEINYALVNCISAEQSLQNVMDNFGVNSGDTNSVESSGTVATPQSTVPDGSAITVEGIISQVLPDEGSMIINTGDKDWKVTNVNPEWDQGATVIVNGTINNGEITANGVTRKF